MTKTKAQAAQADATTPEATTPEAITTPEATTPEARLTDATLFITAGFASGNPTMVAQGITEALEAESGNAVRSVALTTRQRVILGTGCDALARLARETKVGGNAVTPSEAVKAAQAQGFTEAQGFSTKHIGLCLRSVTALFGREAEAITTARDLWNEQADNGPVAWSADAVLFWAETYYGVPVTKSNRGTRATTLGEAKAKADEATEADAKAQAEAKARRAVIAENVAENPTMVAVKGLRITYRQLDAMTDEQVDALIETLTDLRTSRRLAKAEAAKAEAARVAAVKAAEAAEIAAIRAQAKAEAEAIVSTEATEAAKVA